MRIKQYITALILCFTVSGVFLTLVPEVVAQPAPTINYQGKLTDASGVAVANGTYNIRFWLLQSTSQATTSAIWTESLTGADQVQVTNGLFSVMLGSTSPLTSVDFNQPLFLGVEIGGTGAAAWDGEMSPRKPLGTVPAAFESFKLGGVASSSFLRSDDADTMAATSASTLLTINQSGSGDIFNLLDGGTEVFTVTDGGNVGIGTSTPNGLLNIYGGTAASNEDGKSIILSAQNAGSGGNNDGGSIFLMPGTKTGTGVTSGVVSIGYTEAEIAAATWLGANALYSKGYGYFVGGYIAGNTTGINWGTSSTFLQGSGTSASTDYIRMGTNSTERFRIDGNGNVGIGTTSPYAKLSVAGDIALTGGIYDNNATLGTTGQILQTTGSGVEWVATSTLGLGGVSSFLGLSDTPGSYTAGSLLFTSGSAVTQDNTNLFWDDTNN
ncbi:hypothetical protein KC926_03615, partial [Candidatus Kaiserbacteria bacterium]|nr:hypothetical protein [Candidatus Kaiserbacteria bacterium]